VVDAVMDEGAYHHLASAYVHNLLGAVGHQNSVQAGVVVLKVASSAVVADVVPVLGVEVVPLQDGSETLGQGLVGRLEGGWPYLEGPWDLAHLALGRSSRQL
jgi:hypothetical protein